MFAGAAVVTLLRDDGTTTTVERLVSSLLRLTSGKIVFSGAIGAVVVVNNVSLFPQAAVMVETIVLACSMIAVENTVFVTVGVI